MNYKKLIKMYPEFDVLLSNNEIFIILTEFDDFYAIQNQYILADKKIFIKELKNIIKTNCWDIDVGCLSYGLKFFIEHKCEMGLFPCLIKDKPVIFTWIKIPELLQTMHTLRN